MILTVATQSLERQHMMSHGTCQAPPHNFRANWVSSGLTVLLFLFFSLTVAFTASAHEWKDHGEGATNTKIFYYRDAADNRVEYVFGASVPLDVYRSWRYLPPRRTNNECLYGSAVVYGEGSHGLREGLWKIDYRRWYRGDRYRWRVYSNTYADVGVWFSGSGGKGGEHEVELYYRISATALSKTKNKNDTVNVTMVRKKVDYTDKNGMLAWYWSESESKEISESVEARDWTYTDPSTTTLSLHNGSGHVSVVGLPTGISHPGGDCCVEARYSSP
ncbi:MAG: hypothetical protein OXT69_07655 [Candidatus Poribacteria bacterium]|nr:hypothetical protein [Candidatus Poribacteria bacterium]